MGASSWARSPHPSILIVARLRSSTRQGEALPEAGLIQRSRRRRKAPACRGAAQLTALESSWCGRDFLCKSCFLMTGPGLGRRWSLARSHLDDSCALDLGRKTSAFRKCQLVQHTVEHLDYGEIVTLVLPSAFCTGFLHKYRAAFGVFSGLSAASLDIS